MLTNSTRPIRLPIRPVTSLTSAPGPTLPVWRAANRPSTKNPISHTRISRIVLSDPRDNSEYHDLHYAEHNPIDRAPCPDERGASPARRTLFLHRNILSGESTEAELCSREAGERPVLSRLTFVRGKLVPDGERYQTLCLWQLASDI